MSLVLPGIILLGATVYQYGDIAISADNEAMGKQLLVQWGGEGSCAHSKCVNYVNAPQPFTMRAIME
jgi:hypothetical protein